MDSAITSSTAAGAEPAHCRSTRQRRPPQGLDARPYWPVSWLCVWRCSLCATDRRRRVRDLACPDAQERTGADHLATVSAHGQDLGRAVAVSALCRSPEAYREEPHRYGHARCSVHNWLHTRSARADRPHNLRVPVQSRTSAIPDRAAGPVRRPSTCDYSSPPPALGLDGQRLAAAALCTTIAGLARSPGRIPARSGPSGWCGSSGSSGPGSDRGAGDATGRLHLLRCSERQSIPSSLVLPHHLRCERRRADHVRPLLRLGKSRRRRRRQEDRGSVRRPQHAPAGPQHAHATCQHARADCLGPCIRMRSAEARAVARRARVVGNLRPPSSRAACRYLHSPCV